MPDAEVYPHHYKMSAYIVLGKWKELEELRRGTPKAKIDWAWREAVLQTHLFAGFPRLVEAYGVLEQAGGCGQPAPQELEAHQEINSGSQLFERIYAEHAVAVHQTLRSYHLDFATMIEEHAYARVLMRPGLGARSRELLSVACLISLDQPRQLISHARGARNCGAEIHDLRTVLDSVRDLVNEDAANRAERVIERIARIG
ncbi:MAG: alkylhydroperoxidase/carboxymuconolactone decarboxylase family protein YurZ [Planctomycetota bacterium]|jgi:alkylhydroperoxidase/carboxymuconolactone decarboxylase family protein YurZ